MVLGHAILMTLMIVTIATAIAIAHLRKGTWLVRHRILTITGIVIGAAGVATMAIGKVSKGYPHFATDHSQGATVALVLLVSAPVLGQLLISGRKKLRIPHRAVGALAVLSSIAAAVFGAMLMKG